MLVITLLFSLIINRIEVHNWICYYFPGENFSIERTNRSHDIWSAFSTMMVCKLYEPGSKLIDLDLDFDAIVLFPFVGTKARLSKLERYSNFIFGHTSTRSSLP